ncbi:MAG: diheme cytochrome c [Acidobacteriota bacterium]
MRKRMPFLIVLLSVLTLVGGRLAWADDDDEHESGRPRVNLRVPLLPAYQQECAACHMAYPPGMLPAASWQSIMSGLPKHYGSDASLDAASVKKLTAWLTANAAASPRMSARPPQDRITQAAWFVRKHDEISASVWKRPSIKSAANCMACHAGAEQGDFNEHRVRIPR